MLIPPPLLQAAAVDTALQPQASGQASAVIDVALLDGGTLHGQVFDAQGKPLARAAVSIQQLDREIQAAVTDAWGAFRVTGLRGGMYRIVAGDASGTYRLWAPNTAPPSARRGALVVAGDPEVMLAQCEPHRRGPLQFLRNPWVIAGIVAVAIAVPVALNNLDDDEAQSPD
jgi:hypothetical protein